MNLLTRLPQRWLRTRAIRKQTEKMSTSDFSSKDSSVLEKTVDCDLSLIKNTLKNDLVAKYKLEKCYKWIKENKYERVCLQFPDNLLPDSTSIALYLNNKLGKECYVLGDTSYGSCCVDEIAAQHILGDAIIHFGHACLSLTTRLPVLYIFIEAELDVKILQENICLTFPDKRVILLYDVRYLHLYQAFIDAFVNHSNVIVSKVIVEPVDKTGTDSLLFNRNLKIEDKEKYSAVFLGPDGLLFQNLILALPDVEWYQYEDNNIKPCTLNTNKFLMQRLHLVEKIKDANIIGVLVGTLGVINFLDAVHRVQKLAKSRGKKCYILALGRPNVAKLANFAEIDVFVLVACPENSLSRDYKEYYKPVVTLFEMEMALSGRPWSTRYLSDFSQILDEQTTLAETQDDSDVSLVSGKIRTNDGCESVEDPTLALAERQPWTVSEYTGASFLANRSWKGLEQNLGQTGVEKASVGRRGTAQGYLDEGNQQ